MGNCLTTTTKDGDGLVVDVRKRSFSKRMDMWEKTGTVAFRSSSLKVCCGLFVCLFVCMYVEIAMSRTLKVPVCVGISR
jgi:hypothetical protein